MTVKSILDTDILSEYLKGYDANVVRRGTNAGNGLPQGGDKSGPRRLTADR